MIERLSFKKVFCPSGHSLIDYENPIGGVAGIRLGFRREGAEGLCVLSALEFDERKLMLKGLRVLGEIDEFFCPRCEAVLPVLTKCPLCEHGSILALSLSRFMDYYNTAVFCNTSGCTNGVLQKGSTYLSGAA